jgi:hypothetical protein
MESPREGEGAALYRRLSALRLERGTGFFNMPAGLRGAFGRQRRPRYFHPNCTWRRLRCHPAALAPFDLKTRCWRCDGAPRPPADPQHYLVFVRLGRRRLRNLYDYAALEQKGGISLKDHLALFGYLQALREACEKATGHRWTYYNHNTDIPLLHFKLRRPPPPSGGKRRKSLMGGGVRGGSDAPAPARSTRRPRRVDGRRGPGHPRNQDGFPRRSRAYPGARARRIGPQSFGLSGPPQARAGVRSNPRS